LIEMLGIDPERVIDSDQIRHLEAELLVVPGVPDAHLRTPSWIVRFLRNRLLPASARRAPGRRIYITRGEKRGNRIVINEAEVIGALSELGFTVIDPGAMPVAEQIRTFAEADWIVGPHGGALTNLAFASPGASVVELFAPDYVQGCYWKLCECVSGVTYRYLVGTGSPPRNGRMLGVDSDMTIDTTALLALLDGLPVDSGEPTMSPV
jgi:capsular polysaccharide biosynthesis protein